ncbi:MAG: polysaccharide biosynthesis C-terminal domain-containing protein [Spirochaetia bacterium]|nr:polysaccharide biosynthesis C-terminal domain-containing protein [Spirochaetia bacterium]
MKNGHAQSQWKYIDEPLKERMKKNTVTNILFFILTFPLIFIITPMILKYAGKEAYGVWTLTGTILVFLEFIGLQTPTALSVVIPEYDLKKQSTEVNSILNTLFVFYTVVCAAAGVAFLVFQENILATFFKVSPALLDDARFILLFSVAAFLINFIMLSFGYITGGLNIFYPGNILHIIIGYLRVGAMAAVLAAGYGIRGIAVVQMTSILLETAALLFWMKIIYPPLSFNPAMFSLKRLGSLLEMSLKLLFTRLANAVNYNIDKLVLAYFLTPVAVAYYQIGASISRYVSQVPDMISTASLVPAASELKAKNEQHRLAGIYDRMNKYIFLGAVFIASGIIVFGREFLGLWLGAGYEDAYMVMVFLSIAYGISLIGVPMQNILNGLKKIDGPMKVSATAAALNIILSIVLASAYGLKGALTGTTIAVTAGSIMMYCVFYRELKHGINVVQTFIMPLISALVAWGAVWSMNRAAVMSQGWGVFAAKVALFSVVFAVVDVYVLKHVDNYDIGLLKGFLHGGKRAG